MKVAKGSRGPLLLPLLRAAGATVALLSLSMCATFAPSQVKGAVVRAPAPQSAAAGGAAGASIPPSAGKAPRPAVSSLAVTSPPDRSVDFAGGAPSEAALPTPALPQATALPIIPEPRSASTVPALPVPVAAPVGGGVATVANALEAASSIAAAGAPSTESTGGAASAAGVSAQAAAPAGGTRAAASQSAVRPASPAGAGSGGVSAARSPAGPQAAVSAAKPRQVTRTVYARVGDDITIALTGEGWTFTGGGAGGQGWRQGVSYGSRSTGANGTTFIFKAKAVGKWPLDFTQQNASSGEANAETIAVDVLAKQAFAKLLAEKGATGAPSRQGGAGITSAAESALASAEWLSKEGKYSQALTAYEKAWSSSDPALTEKIAALAYRIGRYDTAKKYWQKNFGLNGTVYGELAVAGLMKTATAQKDVPELRALFDYVRSLTGLPRRPDLLAAGRFLFDAKQWGVARRYLEEYLSRYNGKAGSDAADYLLGEIYAGATPMQNAQKALEYFSEIVNQYPTSAYYDRAAANIVYLRRQFFEIR